MTLKLGLPSKGRLMEKTFEWFAARGIYLSRTGSDREYAAKVEGIDGVELVLLSAGEIPRELEAGRIHIGVTGTDLVREKIAHWERVVEELAPMGFGGADLIIAVPSFWIDVDTLDDLDAAAAAFRATHGHRLRIATKYHRLKDTHYPGTSVISILRYLLGKHIASMNPGIKMIGNWNSTKQDIFPELRCFMSRLQTKKSFFPATSIQEILS